MRTARPQSGYAPVNGLNLYYQIQGRGKPLVLLHGGVAAIEMFGENLPLLAQGRQVIGVDLQAHGRTADIDRPLRFESMADDIAGLLGFLGLETADIMGYSLGGGVALRTAIQHPDRVRKLVLVSTPFSQNGWYPEVLAGMAQMGPHAAEPMKQTPMYQTYANIAPKVEDWPMLLTKLGELLRYDYDWSSEVAMIKVPTLLVVGDADSVRTAHAVHFFELLGGGNKGRQLGRIRHVECTPGDSARPDPLHHLLVSGACVHSQPIPRRRIVRGPRICPPSRVC